MTTKARSGGDATQLMLQALLAFTLMCGFASHAAAQVPEGLANQAHVLKVVTSFSILADMTREVAGDMAEVTSLVRPDSDAHVFEPTPSDARRLAAADLVIINGLHFEGWINRLIVVSGYRGPVIVASQGVAARMINGATDPHAWQDVSNARLYVNNIEQALSAAAPAQRAELKARATAYRLRLDAIDHKIRTQMKALTHDQRRVITSHDAFGYFGQAYGVAFLAPQGWTTGSEASAADVARIIDQIRAQKARALFVENITDPRLIQRIAQEARVRVGGTLYSDALSKPGTVADTYIKMLNHNLSTLTAAMR